MNNIIDKKGNAQLVLIEKNLYLVQINCKTYFHNLTTLQGDKNTVIQKFRELIV